MNRPPAIDPNPELQHMLELTLSFELTSLTHFLDDLSMLMRTAQPGLVGYVEGNLHRLYPGSCLTREERAHIKLSPLGRLTLAALYGIDRLPDKEHVAHRLLYFPALPPVLGERYRHAQAEFNYRSIRYSNGTECYSAWVAIEANEEPLLVFWHSKPVDFDHQTIDGSAPP